MPVRSEAHPSTGRLRSGTCPSLTGGPGAAPIARGINDSDLPTATRRPNRFDGKDITLELRRVARAIASSASRRGARQNRCQQHFDALAVSWQRGFGEPQCHSRSTARNARPLHVKDAESVPAAMRNS